jgi:hypothetical protein
MDVSELDGKTVLLILVNRAAPGRLQLALSSVNMIGGRLEARYSDEHAPIQIDSVLARGAGGPAANLADFVARVPGSEEVLTRASRADKYLPQLIAEPVPGVPLIESPLHGLTLNASRELILLRPASESERAVGSWSSGWSPEEDAIADEEDEAAADQARPRVLFHMTSQSDKMTKRRFITDLIAQGLPLYDAGMHDDDPAGSRGWVSLQHGVSRDEWQRLVAWLGSYPAIRELSQLVEEGIA